MRFAHEDAGAVRAVGVGPVVALRSGRGPVIEQVRAVCELLDVPVLVCPPAAAPPSADLLLQDAAEPEHQEREWAAAHPVCLDEESSEADVAALVLPRDGAELVRRIRAAARTRIAQVVGVVGARGGLGTSSLAAVVARAGAAGGARTALVDLDAVGAGLDLVLGIENESGVRWADLSAPDGDYDGEELVAALPTWRDVRVLSGDWRGGTQVSAGMSVLEALWAEVDVVVLDIARHHGWHSWARVCDEVVLLAGCDVVSAAGIQVTRRALGATRGHLVVRGPAPGGLTAAEVAQACDVPLAAQMRPERSLAAGLERGLGPGDHGQGPLMRTGRLLAGVLGLGGQRRPS